MDYPLTFKEVDELVKEFDTHGLRSGETQDLLEHILRMRVMVMVPRGEPQARQLGEVGKLLAGSYAFVSTTTSAGQPLVPEEWWVMHGQPLLFVELYEEEAASLPSGSKEVPVPSEYGFQLAYCVILYKKGQEIPIWILRLSNSSDVSNARILRLYLLRLHAEHECLGMVLSNIDNGNIDVVRGTEASESLQYYLNESLRRVSRWESKTEKLFYPGIAKIARGATDVVTPGRRDSLLQRLRQIGIRKNILLKVERYVYEREGDPSTNKVVLQHIERYFENVNKGGRVGDDYNVSGENQQIGAVGPNAHVHDVNFDQKWTNTRDDLDLPQLAQELAVLRAELRKQAIEPDHDEAVAEVGRAERAAKADDGPRTLEHLARAGKWALNTATTIGATVAAAAIKVALGLP
jgi:hypothetical protein